MWMIHGIDQSGVVSSDSDDADIDRPYIDISALKPQLEAKPKQRTDVVHDNSEAIQRLEPDLLSKIVALVCTL